MQFNIKSDIELKNELTPLQYDVTQNSATEPPFRNAYYNCFTPGIYVDITTGEPLFSSTDKFESGCGWPAFSKPIDPSTLAENTDQTHGMIRTEVRSNRSNAHLGHVFDDAPKSLGGIRYCINSAALRFIPKDQMVELGYEKWLPYVIEPSTPLSKIKITQGDITTLTVDAIVNAANSSLLGGGGVDGAIHRAAGAELLAECRTLHGCKTGQAKITKGYHLPAKYIIHTVGPVYRDGNKGESTLLASCYTNSLLLAVQNNVKTIAFPCISTGIYKYPFVTAAKIALESIIDFLNQDSSIEEVLLVCFSQDDFSSFTQIFDDFSTNYVQ